MRENGLRQRDGETAEEEEERNPFDILEEHHDKVTFSKTVLQHSKADITQAEEDHRRHKLNLETLHVESINGELPAEQDIVDQ